MNFIMSYLLWIFRVLSRHKGLITIDNILCTKMKSELSVHRLKGDNLNFKAKWLLFVNIL